MIMDFVALRYQITGTAVQNGGGFDTKDNVCASSLSVSQITFRVLRN
jgi:hypothetical protein